LVSAFGAGFRSPLSLPFATFVGFAGFATLACFAAFAGLATFCAFAGFLAFAADLAGLDFAIKRGDFGETGTSQGKMRGVI
jgi:hypothetical protein